MSVSASQLLSDVENAIQALVTGAKEYRIGNRMVKREDLNNLMDTRDRLKREIARANTSPVRVAKVGNPRVTDR